MIPFILYVLASVYLAYRAVLWCHSFEQQHREAWEASANEEGKV